MKPIQIIAQDLFDKVRSRFTNLEMGDETGAVTIDPAQARFFDFDFVNEGVNLGRVSISLNDLGSLKIYYSQGITENQDDRATQMWFNFLKEMRLFSMRRLLRFDTRDIAKTNLDKNDFQHLAATQGPKEEPDMNTMNETKKIKKEDNSESEKDFKARQERLAAAAAQTAKDPERLKRMMKIPGYAAAMGLAKDTTTKEEVDMGEGLQESRWNHKSSSKTSRAVQGKTEVIVRHAKAVEETYPGARSQSKNIKAIFIQNHDGERFKYPFIHTAGAFAMAQHVDHGGVPHDPAGKAIIKMSENIAKLGEFQRHIQRSALHDDAHGIAERAIGHMNELKAKVAALGKRHHYQAWREDFEMSGMGDNTDEMVLDAVTLEDYKSKFTEINFQEELTSYFPLLHSIMSETNAVDLEEYVGEAAAPWEDENKADDKKDEPTNTKGKDGADHGGNSRARHLARQAIPKEKSAAESIDTFEEWAEATEQGKLTDDQILELKQALSDLQASGNPLQLGPDGQTAIQFFSELGLDDADLKEKLEAATELDPSGDGIEIMKLWAQESYPELLVALGMSGTGEEQPPEAAPPAPEAGAAPAPVAPPAPEQPVAEGKSSMVQEVAKIVKSFYNQSNESVGPFRAPENIALDCKKQVTEKFGEKAGEQAYEMAEAFINKLTQEWHQKHGRIKSNPVDHGDGLSVDGLKEILGRIKQKVEGIGQPEMEEKDDWHLSKHVTDPQKQKELEPHNKNVHRDSYADRAAYLDAAGVKRDQEQHEDGPKASEVPAWKRKEQGKAPLTTQDLEKERNQSRTTKPGLDAHAAKMGVGEGEGDFSQAIGNLNGWYEVDSNNPNLKKYKFDDQEDEYYADGTVLQDLKTGKIKIEFNDKAGEYGGNSINDTFNSIGDAMDALGTITTQRNYNTGKAPTHDTLAHRNVAGPDDIYKTDRAGKKGTLTKSRMDTMKGSSQYRMNTGPKGPLPEMADILRLAGIRKK